MSGEVEKLDSLSLEKEDLFVISDEDFWIDDDDWEDFNILNMEQPKPRPFRDIDYYDENLGELLKEYKYLYKAEAKYDLIQVLHNYQDLHPKIERCSHAKGGRTEELLTLRGTVPINFKESTYNIPVQIYVLRTHPKQAPIAFVKPLKNMIIRPSKNVDKSGLVYLRYLVDWRSPRSNTLALCKLLSRTFSEYCPVFTEDRVKKTPEKDKSVRKTSRFRESFRRFSVKSKDSGKAAKQENGTVGSGDKTSEINDNKIVEEDEDSTTSDTPSENQSNESKGSYKNVSFAEQASMDEIPDDILDESLDSLYSSSVESIYSDRSVTILAGLNNQKYDSDSIWNSSKESIFSERSVSYLLDLEKQWNGHLLVSPQPSLDSRRDHERKAILNRSFNVNKRDPLRRLSRLSLDSDIWPTPPCMSPMTASFESHIDSLDKRKLSLQRQDSIASDKWPEPPVDVNDTSAVINHNIISKKPEELPTITYQSDESPVITNQPEASPVITNTSIESPKITYQPEDSPGMVEKSPTKTQHHIKSLSQEVNKTPVSDSYSPKKEYISTETQYDTLDKADKSLATLEIKSSSIDQSKMKYNNTEEYDNYSYMTKKNEKVNETNEFHEENLKTPTNRKKLRTHEINSFEDEIALDFSECGHSSSKESTPRQNEESDGHRTDLRGMSLTKGGIVKRKPPEKKQKPPSIQRKESSLSTDSMRSVCSCDCKQTTHSWPYLLDYTDDPVELAIRHQNMESKPHSNNQQYLQTSQSVDSILRSDEFQYESMYQGYNNKASPSPKKKVNFSPAHQHNSIDSRRHFDGGGEDNWSSTKEGGLENGFYERVNMVNGYKNREHVNEARIYEPIILSNTRTESMSLWKLNCRYKSIGCTTQNESELESMSHTEDATNHHMVLLLNKVEHLTDEVQTLKQKLKNVGIDE